MEGLSLESEPGAPGSSSSDGSLPIGELGPVSGEFADEIDWETTRYLAAATQLDLRYARRVARRIIGEPFRAVAPAAGADVVVVTRWAPSPPSLRVKKRLAEVQEQQNGNLVVFHGSSAFVGSGYGVVHDRILVNTALGERKNGERQPLIPFSTLELYDALEAALKGMGFPDRRVPIQLRRLERT